MSSPTALILLYSLMPDITFEIFKFLLRNVFVNSLTGKKLLYLFDSSLVIEDTIPTDTPHSFAISVVE